MSHPQELTDALSSIANELRADSIRATTKAGSGHPTTCCSAAEIVATLFFGCMRLDPKNPANPVADRFVLSKGHAAPILYAAWKAVGYYSDEDIMSLREIESDLEGHPTPRLPYVDVATGSLGQGLGVGVGLAINSEKLDKTNYRTFVLLGDGEAAEGSVWEAAQLAAYYNLKSLTAIVDMNRLGQSQATMLQHEAEVLRRRFEAFGWNAVAIDGHNVAEVLDALTQAQSAGGPTAIIARTFKGKGVPFAENKDNWHGKPFKAGAEADEALAAVRAGIKPGYVKPAVPAPPAVSVPGPKVSEMPAPPYKMGDLSATREAYGEALAVLGAADSRVVALDGDTKNSTFSDKFLKAFPDRFVECFIAEQNMISVASGLSARGKIPFASSFAVFLSRGFDQVRMAGISRCNLKLCGSHVGVSIGEDGPSQMGLEDLALYRSIPGGIVLYPSDAVSAYHAVRLAAQHKGLAYIRTSRPKTPVIYDTSERFAIGAAKVIREKKGARLTIATGGVTLFEALTAAEALSKGGIEVNVIDLFSIKPIDKGTLVETARASGNLILTVEDHYPEGGIGEAVAGAVADTDIRVHSIAVTELPRSGKPEELVAKYGIDSNSIIARVRKVVAG